ncbi:MAG: UTP--glucose-1-phosphate uridylyltransferase [Candidatus Protochlamydia sp.]|nr:UTP--glucose-1-phosphate uridylyltransferase [Candidatus Protochlamydia sp.]
MQLIKIWPELRSEEKLSILNQLGQLNLSILYQQKELLKEKPLLEDAIEPFTNFAYAGSLEDQERGKRLVREGKMGCLLLAGGQGTRLKFSQPKGCYPVSVIKEKSLFQLLAEKVKSAGEQAGHPLNLAIMTSPENDQVTKEYFLEHAFFGLSSSQISFFTQSTLPLLDAEGHLFLESRSKIAEGPSGNGNALHDFFNSGLWGKWAQSGIEYVNMVLVDNPLADPFDFELLGYHVRSDSDITLKCTEKIMPEEKVGVVVKKDGRCQIIEYTELTEEKKTARQPNGSLTFCCANLSLFCFSMNFVKKTALSPVPLPLHKAWKAAKFLSQDGTSVLSEAPKAWKFERYIFDVLNYTDKVGALLYPRGRVFAPLKNAENSDTLETVRQALQQREKEILESITTLKAPKTPFELSAEFYYPTPQLLGKWKGRIPESPYIEP